MNIQKFEGKLLIKEKNDLIILSSNYGKLF